MYNFRERLFIKPKQKVHLYSTSYLKLRFVLDNQDKNKLYSLLCCKSLCNNLIRNKKLEDGLKNVHPEHVKKPFAYFQCLNESRQKNKQMSLCQYLKTKVL